MSEPTIDLDETTRYVTQMVKNSGPDGITEEETTHAMMALQNLFIAAGLAELLDEGLITVGWDRQANELRFFSVEQPDDE